jgi:hypothetical protein
MAGNIKARILQNNTIRAKQVAIGQSGSADISQKSLNELADVDVTETDDGLFHMMQHQISGLLLQI